MTRPFIEDIPLPGVPEAHPTSPVVQSSSADGASRQGLFIHHERCDCGECRCRYRQGDSIEREDHSTVVVGWVLLILLASALACLGWVLVLS